MFWTVAHGVISDMVLLLYDNDGHDLLLQGFGGTKLDAMIEAYIFAALGVLTKVR